MLMDLYNFIIGQYDTIALKFSITIFGIIIYNILKHHIYVIQVVDDITPTLSQFCVHEVKLTMLSKLTSQANMHFKFINDQPAYL